MKFERDKYFFHYTTREAAFEHILPTGKLRFSRYSEMRDPLDAKRSFFAGGAGDFSDAEQQEQAAGYFTFLNLAQEARHYSFLLSLTIDAPFESEEREPFCRGWARARMWEHYAEKHLGVCLVLERDCLAEAVTASLVEQGYPPPHHQPVLYDGDAPHSQLLDLAKLGKGVTLEEVLAHIEENREEFFFHKLLDWQSEREYRFATTCLGAEELFADYGDALTAVIAGGEIPYWQRSAAISACEAVETQALYLNWTPTGPRLTRLREHKSRRDEIKANISPA